MLNFYLNTVQLCAINILNVVQLTIIGGSKMDRVNKSNISKFFLTLSMPFYLIVGYFVVTESFEIFLSIFSEDFWRLLTAY